MVSEEERWVPIPGYDTRYEVSSCGRVRTIARRVPHNYRKGHTRLLPSRIKKTRINQRGYASIILSNEHGKKTHYELHRLVANAFLGELPRGYHTHHIDGDSANARVDNLCYVPASLHLHLSNRGQNARRNILTEMDVFEIRKLLNQGVTQVALAKRYGVHKTTIKCIRHGKSWAWLKEE